MRPYIAISQVSCVSFSVNLHRDRDECFQNSQRASLAAVADAATLVTLDQFLLDFRRNISSDLRDDATKSEEGEKKIQIEGKEEKFFSFPSLPFWKVDKLRWARRPEFRAVQTLPKNVLFFFFRRRNDGKVTDTGGLLTRKSPGQQKGLDYHQSLYTYIYGGF